MNFSDRAIPSCWTAAWAPCCKLPGSLGARPEELNITDPALIEGIHGQYAAAGSRIVNANTFGASAHKLAGSAYTLEQVITAGIENCKRACAPYGALTALDVGPLGELLEPSGTLAFEDAVAEYARIVKAGEAAGADLIFLRPTPTCTS